MATGTGINTTGWERHCKPCEMRGFSSWAQVWPSIICTTFDKQWPRKRLCRECPHLHSARCLTARSYAYSFDAALKDAATSDAATRQGLMNSLMKRKDARQAHPTLEHILPIYICAGAAGSDAGEQLWTLPEGSLSWTQYRFGEL